MLDLARKLSVLVLDDDQDWAATLCAALEEASPSRISSTWVGRLSDCLANLISELPDVLILDLWLPDSSGLDTLMAVHRQAENLPIVVISGRGDEALGFEATRAGASAVLHKDHAEPEHVVRAIYYALEPMQPEPELAPTHPNGQDIQVVTNTARKATDAATSEAASTGGEFALLGSISVALASSLDYDALLNAIPQLFVPQFANGCLLAVPDDGQMWPATFLADDSADGIIHEIRDLLAIQLTRENLFARVMNTGTSAVLESGIGTLAPAPGHPGHNSLGSHSICLIPLNLYGGTGALLLVRTGSPAGFEPSQLAIADRLGELVSTTIRNARQYSELHGAIRGRDEMMAAAAHDLKNPLSSVKLQLHLMERRAAALGITNQDLIDALERLQTSVARASAQADELMELAGLQLGHVLQLRRRPFDLVQLAAEVIEGQSSERARSVELKARKQSILGRWDKVRIQRVLANLIDNGLKYSARPAGVEVDIWEERTAGRRVAVVSIRDFGIGIPQKDQARIFQPFYRASNARRRVGFGIGLSGVKSIVEAHGGTIEVQSQEGAGSTFTFRLPTEPDGLGRNR